MSIDDFGTGYSSLSYLSRLPVDTIKIDRSLVNGLSGGAGHDTSIVRAIVALADVLALHIVAEGVETPQQHEYSASRLHLRAGLAVESVAQTPRRTRLDDRTRRDTSGP